MVARRQPDEIIRGLKTTSAKIKALAQAGYDRVEISKLLNKRYQHIRNVLIGFGITDGVRRQAGAARERITVNAAPAARSDTSLDVLMNSGFQLLGEWMPEPESAIRLDGKAPLQPGIYSFVVNDRVVYVGLTISGLRTRLDQYRVGYEGQKTNARVKKLIAEALSGGQRVKVLVATPEPLEWHGLPVNTAAGLEAALIQMIRPAWNKLGVA